MSAGIIPEGPNRSASRRVPGSARRALVVFFMLQLVMFCEGIHSEHRLTAEVFPHHCARAHHVSSRSWRGRSRSGEFAHKL